MLYNDQKYVGINIHRIMKGDELVEDLDNNQKVNEIINEISECREDERSSQNQMVQIIATSGTILGVILGASVFSDSIISKEILFLLSNIIFCTACTYIVTLGIGNVLRYHYIQNLEDKLSLLVCDNHIEKINLVHWMSFASPITTRNPLHLKSKSAFLHYITYTISVASAIAFSIGVTCFLYYKLDEHTVIDNISMIVLIIIFVLCLLCYILISLDGKQISKEAYKVSLDKKRARLKQKTEQSIEENTEKAVKRGKDAFKILLYFIYPKYKDLQKMFLIIVGYFLGIILMEGYIDVNKGKENFSLLIETLVVIDFLLYQARYQWNDIRGIEEDKLKEDRLPVKILGGKHAIIISLSVICIRFFFMMCIFYYLADQSIFVSMCLNTGLVIILSILYEYVRSKENNFGTFFFVSLGYPFRILIGICAAYPEEAEQIISSFYNLLFGIWKKSSLTQLYIDRTQHFSLNVLAAFMGAYTLMGAFSVIIPWLYEAIEEQRKYGQTTKKHYTYLLSKVKKRYQKYITEINGDASTLLCARGKISDLWNWTYIVSILIFSVLISIDCYFSVDNHFLDIILLELLFIISVICICIFPDTRRKQNLSLIFLAVIFMMKLILSIIRFGVVSYYILIYCNQVAVSLIYWFLRYHFRDDYNFLQECKKIILRLFILFIGQGAWNYLCKQSSKNS